MPKLNFLLRIKFSSVRKFVVVILLILASASGGYYLGVKGYKFQVQKAYQVKISRQTPPDKNVDFSLFWRVWDTLGAKYFDKTKLVPSEMVYGAISGMVSSVGDPYTVFLPPKENKIVQEDLNGSFEGVGIQIGFKGTRLVVVAPLPDSPAERGGVKAGDFIVHIKDEAKGIDVGTSGISLPDAVSAIRGKTGTKVTLTLLRDEKEEPVVVELTRAKLNVPSVTLKFIGEGENVAYMKVNKFASETDKEWGEAVAKVVENPKAKFIIVDLRNNPGGYLQSAVTLASDFIETGKAVVIEEGSDGSRSEFKVDRLGRLLKYPVIVLVNEGSASASEILAGALRDQKKVRLIGATTFGKGTIQEPIEIDGGSGLHITTARWLTPNGTWVNEKGLTPDVKIEDDERTKDDEQLLKAIELLSL